MTATHLARGLVAQLQRVNESPARLLERITDLERENARLRQLLADVRAELAAYRDSPLSQREGSGVEVQGFLHNNRPAVTAAQIARQHNVSISSVYRQLQKEQDRRRSR